MYYSGPAESQVLRALQEDNNGNRSYNSRTMKFLENTLQDEMAYLPESEDLWFITYVIMWRHQHFYRIITRKFDACP